MCRRAAAGRQSIRALFENMDALLYPPATGEVPEGLLDSGSALLGALWSLMHLPCVCADGHRACGVADGGAGDWELGVWAG